MYIKVQKDESKLYYTILKKTIYSNINDYKNKNMEIIIYDLSILSNFKNHKYLKEDLSHKKILN